MPHPLLAARNLGSLSRRRLAQWYRQGWHSTRRWSKAAGAAGRGARAAAKRTARAGRQAAAAARWSVLRQRGVGIRALCKLSANSRARQDRFVLSTLENHLVRQAGGMQKSIWIAPRAVRHSVRQIVPANVITFVDILPLLRPVSSEPTIRFVDEIVRQGLAYRDTTLFHEVDAGKLKRRRLGAETVLLTTDNFVQYYDKCMRQAEFVAARGLQPWDKTKAANYDGDIAMLLSRDGELMFLRRGTHRLGIARALGLERIPVQVYMVTGACVAHAAADRHWHRPWRLPAALARARALASTGPAAAPAP